VITLGAEGIYYRTRDGREARAPAQARAVFDVTGAGDTVVAHLALYLAGGFDMDTAISLANHAAGIVVGRLGTYSVTRAELTARLTEEPSHAGKLLDEASLALQVENWRAAGRRIVFSNGCFDVLHAGHVEYLRFARSKGDVLIIGVNDDESVRRLKGAGRPVNSLADRMLVLSALEMVEAVVPFSEDTPARIIERITPHVLVKGEDWKDKGVVGREWVEAHGGHRARAADARPLDERHPRARSGVSEGCRPRSWMRILFVYPNLYTQMGFNHGLASLPAVLRATATTRLVNLNENLPPTPTPDDVYELVRDWKPGLIGFSCLTMQYESAVKVATFLRTAAYAGGIELPPLVVGGIHPTMVPEDVMRDAVWDHVGVGECEDSLLALVTRLEAGERPDDVPNFLSWKAGKRPAVETGTAIDASQWVRNPVGEFPDLEALPEPHYELFDVERITDHKQGWFGLMTSRGCPYRCTYCLNHKVVDLYKADLGRSTAKIGFFRYRPPEKMIEEIRGVVSRWPNVGMFILDDDLFTMNPPHAIAFCKAYAEAGIGVPFVVNSHVKRLDPEVARWLSIAGCRILKLGIESGSPRVRRDVLKRHMTQRDILETSASAEEWGLHTSGFVMVGLPGESHEERWETVETLAEARLGRFRTSFFYPFPGTEGYEMAVAGGYVPADLERSMSTFTDGSILDFGPEENLYVDKLGTVMPWLVNAALGRYHDAPAAAHYRPWAEQVLAMDREEWTSFKWRIRAIDAELSAGCVARRELHYSIRYNAFMGVRSDYFVAEESGIEWFTAAAKPDGERVGVVSLAAAAAQSC
jgi:rfaE bifunctional protein nucleotidyltransferase chain/domain